MRWTTFGIIAFIAALVLVAGGGGYYAYSHHQPATSAAAGPPPNVPVTTTIAAGKTFPVVRTGLGSVRAFNTVTVRSRVDGAIDKILFSEGDVVQEGQLLAKIDPAPYQANLDAANGKKTQDEAALANAQADLNRYSTLAKQDFASGQQLDTQRSTVRQATAQLEVDNASIANAKIQLNYTDIRAPIAGRLGFRLVDQGNVVTAAAQNGIVTITQVQPISLVFTLPEDTLDLLRAARARGKVPVKALTADGARVLAQGEVEVINNQVDPATGTFQIKATFPNTDNALWPGLDVTASVQLDLLQNAIVLPQGAVQHAQQGLSVYVVGADSKVSLRPVETGESDGDNIVVTKGVNNGDRVVVAGQYRLQDGALVSESAPPADAPQKAS
jgi:multidrug efflux system membrane fusion protein